jgi:hypothetical protein
MTIMENGFLSLERVESAADNPTSSTSHSSLRSRLSSVTPRTQTGGVTHLTRVNPHRGRQEFRESFLRSATARYGLQSHSPRRDTHTSRNYVTDNPSNLRNNVTADNEPPVHALILNSVSPKTSAQVTDPQLNNAVALGTKASRVSCTPRYV